MIVWDLMVNTPEVNVDIDVKTHGFPIIYPDIPSYYIQYEWTLMQPTMAAGS